MIEEQNDVTVHETAGWISAAIGILAILAIVGIGFGYYDYNAISTMNASQQAASAQFKTTQQDAAQQIAALDKRLTQSDVTNTALQSDVSVVTKRLRLTEGQLKQARDEAAKIRTDNEQKIADLDTDVKTQLATKATTDDLNAVNGSVTVVKTDLDATKSDLKMARSELGTLIARNHEEIDVLRRMGERDYVEFTVDGRGKPQKIGAITVELRSVDTKKNKFTVALVVDDLRTEKKDRTVDEPIIFYPRGTHQADEFVVNSVAKDKISGYVSMPKNPAPNATVASGN
jgi:hypothetical protein